jgi:small-conductance mechanosensitive channel
MSEPQKNRNLQELFSSFEERANYYSLKWKKRATTLKVIAITINVFIILLGFLIGLLSLKKLSETTEYLVSLFGFLSAFLKTISIIFSFEKKSLIYKNFSEDCYEQKRKLRMLQDDHSKSEEEKQVILMKNISRLGTMKKRIFSMELGKSFLQENLAMQEDP